MIADSEAFIWDNTTAEQTVEGIKLTARVDAASSFDGGLEARGAHRHVPQRQPLQALTPFASIQARTPCI